MLAGLSDAWHAGFHLLSLQGFICYLCRVSFVVTTGFHLLSLQGFICYLCRVSFVVPAGFHLLTLQCFIFYLCRVSFVVSPCFHLLFLQGFICFSAVCHFLSMQSFICCVWRVSLVVSAGFHLLCLQGFIPPWPEGRGLTCWPPTETFPWRIRPAAASTPREAYSTAGGQLTGSTQIQFNSQLMFSIGQYCTFFISALIKKYMNA